MDPDVAALLGADYEAQPRKRRARRDMNPDAAQRPRSNYFQGNAAAQRRYYGVKNNINFQRTYPLRDYSYLPLQRGSQQSLDLFGPSYKQASEQQRMNRRSYLMKGKGLYRGRGGYWGRAIGNLFGMGDLGDKLGDAASNVISNVVPGGREVMSYVGSDLGQSLGKLAAGMTGGGLYKKRGRGLYRGRGAYTTTNGLIQAPDVVPQFGPTDIHEVIIRNREFVQDVYAPSSGAPFEAVEYPLNPGMPKLFQWLSQLAINFEEYEIRQLIVTYKSTVTDFAAASGQVGQVIMATQYNATSDPFGSKEEMMLYEGGMSCKTTENMQHGIECDPNKLTGHSYKYVRVGALPTTEDLKEYDLGKLSMAIVGIPSTYAGQLIGELWVSYTVALRKPKIASGAAYNARRDLFVYGPYTVTSAGQYVPNPSLLYSATRNTGLATVTVSQGQNLTSFAQWDNLFEPQRTALTNVSPGLTAWTTQFLVTFDDSFNGCVRIRFFRKTSYALLQTAGGTPTPDSLAIAASDNISAGTTPSIFRFYDIPSWKQNLNQTVWTHMHHTLDNQPLVGPDAGSSSLVSSATDTELHLRIIAPSSGIKNQLVFGWQSVAANYQWDIEISQYNTFLSSSDSGRGSAAILLSDINGNPKIWA